MSESIEDELGSEQSGTAFERRPLDAAPDSAGVVTIPALGHATLAPVRELIESDAIDVVTTDVFDTLVWRRTLNPADAFVDLGERLAEGSMLAPTLNAGSFASLRRLAEERVRADRVEAFGDPEVNLEEIYAGFPEWIFNGHQPDIALLEEIELERELIVPDLDVAGLLAYAVERGKTIVAISDIYFSADQLRRLLSQPGLGELPFRRLFTSSDHRDGKAGGLFDIALNTLGVKASQVVHMGDNVKADIEPAVERGIRTVFLEKRSAGFESMLDREAMFGRPSIGKLAGGPGRPGPNATVDFGLTALRAKTEHREEGLEIASGLREHWRFGATVLGPVLAGFGEWVHEQARAMGAERVHCLMREGAFLSTFIDSAGPGAAWPVPAERLWLSRYVATRAAIGDANERELERLMFGVNPPTVEQFCRRLGFPSAQIPTLAGYADTVLYDPIIRRLVLDAVLDDAKLRGQIVADSRQLRDRVVRMLLASAPGDGPIVVVDIGWGATIQQRLAESLAHAGVDREVAGLYLMTNEVAGYAVSRGEKAIGFVMNNGFPTHLRDSVMRAPEILEQSLMPDVGTQIGIDENLQPVVAANDLPTQQQAEAEAMRQGAFAFQRDYVRYRTVLPGKLISLSQAPEALAAILTRSVMSPTAAEITAFSAWVHDENFGSDDQTPLIDERWATKVGYLTPKQLAEQPMQEMYWPFGVAHRYDEQLGELAAAVNSGAISWAATATPLETGSFEVRITDGVAFEQGKPYTETPERNRRGLSFLSGSLTAHQIGALQIRIAERAGIVRMDWMEFRLFAQGESSPIVIRYEGSPALQGLVAANCLVLPASLIVCTGSPALLHFNVRAITPRVVARVEFETGFAVLPGGPVLPGATRLEDVNRTVGRVERLQATRTWQAVKPARDVARKVMRRRPQI